MYLSIYLSIRSVMYVCLYVSIFSFFISVKQPILIVFSSLVIIHIIVSFYILYFFLYSRFSLPVLVVDYSMEGRTRREYL